MAKYLLLKHYRRFSGPDDLVYVPMDQWTPPLTDSPVVRLNRAVAIT